VERLSPDRCPITDIRPTSPAERIVSAPLSRVEVWTVPTNEEIVVARQAQELIAARERG